ncbi:hypothetical protein Plhal304r1_c008g0031521 [Plasmopara halstedii]
MGSTRHISRWRLPLCQTSVSLSSSSHVSLRYLDEFVGKLQCASDLLQLELFPDAKEITESMALFNAVRRYIAPTSKSRKVNDKPDGIIVVGDGSTPRTAAMFAYRMQGWKCYSVDPAMDTGTSERSKRWAEVSNLIIVRNKIENVRISLKRVILVLVHAHVSLDQALSAVEAEEICGVMTIPCCNWYGLQETLFGRKPDLVYDDFSVLSDHREIRLWFGDRSHHEIGSTNATHTDLTLTSNVMKGCIRKIFVENDDILSKETIGMDIEKLTKRHDGVLDFISKILCETSDNDVSVDNRANEDAIGNSLRSAIASHLRLDASLLVLDQHSQFSTVHLLLQEGYSNVYIISTANKLSLTMQGEIAFKTLKLQLSKATMHKESATGNVNLRYRPCGYFVLQSSFTFTNIGKQVSNEELITVTFDNNGQPALSAACLLDMNAIFHGFRGRSKKNPSFFRHLFCTLDQLVSTCSTPSLEIAKSASLVCISPRKQWRKREYLAHADLGYDVHSLVVTTKQCSDAPMYIYCCNKRSTESSSVPVANIEGIYNDLSARDTALIVWREQEEKLRKRQSELLAAKRLAVVDNADTRMTVLRDQEQADAVARETQAEPKKIYVQVVGTIKRIRSFSKGMTFLSIMLDDCGVDRPLQAFLQSDTMGLSLPLFAKVTKLLRTGDKLVAIGFMTRNAHGHSMLQIEAICLNQTGKYEAYN